jgi:predicted nucleic acid-binding protein
MNEQKLLLIDTSAWIVSFRGNTEPDFLNYLKSKISQGSAATSQIIILELLYGCRTEQEKEQLHDELYSLEILGLNDDVWARAYDIGFDLRRKGITVPTVDIIIAALALEYHCTLLHFDRHFKMVKEHINDLDLMEISSLAQ